MARTVASKNTGKKVAKKTITHKKINTPWRTTLSLTKNDGTVTHTGTQTQNVGPDFEPLTQYLAMELNATSKKFDREMEVTNTQLAWMGNEINDRDQQIQEMDEQFGRMEVINENQVTVIERLEGQLNDARFMIKQFEARCDHLEEMIYNGIKERRPFLYWKRPTVMYPLKNLNIWAEPWNDSDELRMAETDEEQLVSEEEIENEDDLQN